jgi:hypothetical protein
VYLVAASLGWTNFSLLTASSSLRQTIVHPALQHFALQLASHNITKHSTSCIKIASELLHFKKVKLWLQNILKEAFVKV